MTEGAITKATTLKDAWAAFDLGPLSGEKRAWRVDLCRGRGWKGATRLETFFDLRTRDRFLQVAFTGHRGCGKSTELLRLKEKWDPSFFVVYFEVTELLDANDIAFSDLFLSITMKLAQAFHDAGMPLDKRLLQNVERFAESVTKETTQELKSQIEVGAKASAGFEIPFVTKLKAWITSQFKASTQHKTTIRRIFERDITRLITDTNLLFYDARQKLKEAGRGQGDLILVLDNLERLPPDAADRLIFQHGDFLKQMRANVVYTVPVSVLHSPKGIERVFPCHDIVPMLNVYSYDRKKLDLGWDDAGVREMVQTVAARVDIPSVFESEEFVHELARHSGGCLRHLMQLGRGACEAAYTRRAPKIASEDVEDALRHMQFDFERMIPPEHYPLLAEVARTKNVPNSDIGRAALYNLSTLEYDGGRRWNYVHPLVRRIERFTEARRARPKKAQASK